MYTFRCANSSSRMKAVLSQNGCFIPNEKCSFSSLVSRETASDLQSFLPKQSLLHGTEIMGGNEGRCRTSGAKGGRSLPEQTTRRPFITPLLLLLVLTDARLILLPHSTYTIW
ncbi:hypothetical protein AMECASPLE_033498 [Ameca splendens]|uniref:Uncharacterized protein n=1 Tax=Ameca splendens TaxID=208324 RepID=A0ABV0YTV7_9TELE